MFSRAIRKRRSESATWDGMPAASPQHSIDRSGPFASDAPLHRGARHFKKLGLQRVLTAADNCISIPIQLFFAEQ